MGIRKGFFLFCFSELYVAFICRSGAAVRLPYCLRRGASRRAEDTQLHKTVTEAFLSRERFLCSGILCGSRGTVELT